MKPIFPWLFPVLVAGLAIYIAIRTLDYRSQDRFDFWFPLGFGTFITAFVCVVACGLGCWLSNFVGRHCDQVWIKGWTAKMINMRSADGIEGRIAGGIFLTVGYVQSNQTYYYYTEVSPSAFQAHHWTPDSNTTIFEEDRQDGQVQQWSAALKHSSANWFAFAGDEVRVDFHIPKGSIAREGFKLQ